MGACRLLRSTLKVHVGPRAFWLSEGLQLSSHENIDLPYWSRRCGRDK